MKAWRYVVLALVAFAGVPGARAASPPWPSAAQIDLVHARRQSFPVADQISAVDWYAPLDIVHGMARPEDLPARRSIAASALAAAHAYAAAKNSYALLIWRDGGLELETYWSGFGRQSRFETASLHKTVVALALGAAVADGAVHSVDDPLSRYLPYLAGTRRGALTLRLLLEMRSGIETPGERKTDASPYWQFAFGDDLHQAVAHWPDSCVAESEFCYANADTQLLGWALEAATGQRYADYLSTRLWQKMGAGDARVYLDGPGGSAHFSCCLQATARDWLRVGLLILDRGRAGGQHVIPADWIDRMTAASAANPTYGWQIWRGSPYAPLRRFGKNILATVPASRPFLRDDLVYLEGTGGQRVYVIPSTKTVIVRIGAAAEDWDDSLLPNLILEAEK